MTMFPITTKTDDYTLTASDTDKEIQFYKSSSVTGTLPASSTAGNGYSVILRNIGSGDLTILPDGSETIEGDSSVVLLTNHWCWLGNDGSSFRLIYFFPDRYEFMRPVKKTNNTTIQVSDAGDLIMLDSATGKTFTLPAVSATTNRRNVFAFKNINDGLLTIDGDGTELIDSAISVSLEKDRSIILVGDRTDSVWRSLAVAGEITGVVPGGPETGDGLILEDGSGFLLLETGDFLLLE